MTVILSILSTLSHHQHRKIYPNFMQKILPEATTITSEVIQDEPAQINPASATSAANNKTNNLYWAKGTGFGTGSTIQQWDAERTMMQQ